MDMGDCAVVQAGRVSLLILSNSVMTVDPAMYRAVGLEPNDAGIVVVKSHIQFRAGYAGIARAIILLGTGRASGDRLGHCHSSESSATAIPIRSRVRVRSAPG